MQKPVEVKFDEGAYKEYVELQNLVIASIQSRTKPTYEQLLTSINNAVKNLKINPHYGDLIPRKYLNSKLIERYGTDKIFRIELVGYWRLLYTLIGGETKIIAFILEYMDHDTYNKLFGYRNR